MNRPLIIVVLIVALLAAVDTNNNNSNASLHKNKCPKQKLISPCRCLSREDELQVWCSHSDLPHILDGLRALGEHLLQPIDELILENNQLPSMPGRAFLPLKVMRLMLRYNGLERLSSDWLTGLESSLMELFIVEPELRSLPDESLGNLKRLEAVTIQTNLMKRLPDFSGLINLRYLLVQSTNLVELSPRHFRNLPRLEKFHVAGSLRLERLEAAVLQDLPRLKLVNITDCGLSWLHVRSLTHLPTLTDLSLVGNKIKDASMIGRAARELPSLEIIHLDGNHIQRLNEASFVDLPSLRTITLANNRITELHHGAFHRVPKLHSIDLNHNLVRKVHPESFLQHSGSGLEELWLIDNDINHVTELSALLDALPRLKFLDMSHNRLESIPFGALRGHAMLEQLHLDYNDIQHIDREAFIAMPALRELRLRNNSISDVLEPPFWNLPALKGLDLAGNRLRRITPSLLRNLPSLRKVDVSANGVAFIEPDAFLGTPDLEVVNASQNDLKGVHPATFRHLANLYELDVSDNHLIDFTLGLPKGLEKLHIQRNIIPLLPPSDILPLPSLRLLDVSNNVIQRIPSNAFRTFPLLATLNLGSNALYHLDESSLSGLQHLKVLNLEDNRLSDIQASTFQSLPQMRDLNLRNNRLNLVTHNLIKNAENLVTLDLSSNQIDEIAPNAFDTTNDIQIVNLSHNALVSLPHSLYHLKELKMLDLSNNRLKIVSADNLRNLISLEKLNLSRNYLQYIPAGTFSNLPKLKNLRLDNNEITNIESKAITSLPALKTINLSRNKLVEIHPITFFDLPILQDIQLHQNNLQLIGANAFVKVPHLLMLNLSSNRLDNLDNAGLRNVRSLEMLDLSRNRLGAVQSGVFERMEWLVELRLDDNGICTVRGHTFNNLPRLRVLSLRNNRLTSFPERAVHNLRGNIAVLDIDGNPLACNCNLLWLRAWLEESSVTGPRCSDGILLRESRLSLDECQQNDDSDRFIQPIIPGCEAELFKAPAPIFASTQTNRSKHEPDNHLTAPYPEESDYFYDDYVDYYPESTAKPLQQISSSSSRPKQPGLGDKPSIYAATNKNKTHNHNGAKTKPKTPPKEVVGSPSSSGFTFFGVPLPSLSLNGFNNLLGNGRVESSTNTNSWTKNPPTAERKSAIVNSPPNRGMYYNMPKLPKPAIAIQLNPPELINGGFIPVLPGDGGFKPYHPETHEQAVVKKMAANYNVSIEKVNLTSTTIKPILTRVSTIPTKKSTEMIRNVLSEPAINVVESTTVTVVTSKPIDLASYNEYSDDEDDYSNENTTARIEEVRQANISSTAPTKFEDIFKEVVDNVSLPTNTSEVNPLEDLLSSFSANNNHKTNKTQVSVQKQTPLSTLLIPGGQQPVQNTPRSSSTGHPTITKIEAPQKESEVPLGTNIVAQPHNRLGKNTFMLDTVDDDDSKYTKDENELLEATEENWYFANYNKTNLEPYIGPGINGSTRLCVQWIIGCSFVIFRLL